MSKIDDELASIEKPLLGIAETVSYLIKADLEREYRGLQFLESPIEKIMYLAILSIWNVIRRERGKIIQVIGGDLNSQLESIKSGGLLGENSPVIFCQPTIDNYRLDMALCILVNGAWKVLVIECDGHEFHERTKEQAARDRARDRRLQEFGFLIYRFTGAEIWNTPTTGAAQIMSWLISYTINYRPTTKGDN